jgi:hypothetical protein
MQGEHQALQAPSLVNLMASPGAFRKKQAQSKLADTVVRLCLYK